MKLVLDTSVYIAAFLQKGLASDILILGEEGKIEIFISEEILKEITDKLDKKFKVDEERKNKFVSVIRRSTNQISPTMKLNIIRADPDDNKIIECAVEAGANLIVTMDKHLL